MMETVETKSGDSPICIEWFFERSDPVSYYKSVVNGVATNVIAVAPTALLGVCLRLFIRELDVVRLSLKVYGDLCLVCTPGYALPEATREELILVAGPLYSLGFSGAISPET